MNKVKRGIIYFLIMTVIIVGISYLSIQMLQPKIPEVDHWESYVIRPGDTLWSIVPYEDGYDIEHNSLPSANLIAFETIEIPSWR